MTTSTLESQPTTWSPLRSRLYAVILITSVSAQLAVFMNGLASAWALTDLTDSPIVVSSLQAAVAIPGFLLALLAGALADIASRKKLIVVGQGGSVIVTGLFAILSWTGGHTAATLLGLTAALGVLTALAAPAWIAIIPGLVPERELAGAMTLSSAGVSVAMAAGPAFAGFVIAASGPTAVFALNAVIFVGGLLALSTWKPQPRTGLPPEHLFAAIRLGLQYTWYDRPLKRVIGKVIPFALVATALPALLPVVARFRLEVGPATFGLLSAAGGLGAIAALFVMPKIRARFSADAIVLAAMLIEAAAFAVLVLTHSVIVAFVVLAAAGAGTLGMISTVMTALQIVLPGWIRGRGVAVYLLVLQASFAAGAIIWGLVAQNAGLETALIGAAVALVVGGIVTVPLRLRPLMDVKSQPVRLMDEPTAVTSIYDEDGPIVATATWEVAPDRMEGFVQAMIPVRRALKRHGALRFTLAEDVENPGVLVESFTMATWAEYQKLPYRTTGSDKVIHDALIAASGGDLPDVTAHRQLQLRKPPASATTS